MNMLCPTQTSLQAQKPEAVGNLIHHDRGGVTAAALLPRCGIGGEAMAGADARF